jgi:hypothetical protein
MTILLSAAAFFCVPRRSVRIGRREAEDTVENTGFLRGFSRLADKLH